MAICSVFVYNYAPADNTELENRLGEALLSELTS